MFYRISGEIILKDTQSIAIDCGGVAFRVTTSLNTLGKLGKTGEKAAVYTYMAVREDAIELFGFYDEKELALFKLLVSVSGVGPKAAISVLSELTPDMLCLSIGSGDVKSITRAQGVGPKIAQRIVLELKDKVASFVPSSVSSSEIVRNAPAASSSDKAEALNALTALGFTGSEASAALNSVNCSTGVENMIKEALRYLSRR